LVQVRAPQYWWCTCSMQTTPLSDIQSTASRLRHKLTTPHKWVGRRTATKTHQLLSQTAGQQSGAVLTNTGKSMDGCLCIQRGCKPREQWWMTLGTGKLVRKDGKGRRAYATTIGDPQPKMERSACQPMTLNPNQAASTTLSVAMRGVQGWLVP
jgi:hypothetical protein